MTDALFVSCSASLKSFSKIKHASQIVQRKSDILFTVMSKSIHPKIEQYIEAVLPVDRTFTERNSILLKRKYHPVVCTLACFINFVGPEVVRLRLSDAEDSEIPACESIISQVVLLAVTLKDFNFLCQLTEALKEFSNSDKLFEELSTDQFDIVSACDELAKKGIDLNFKNIWKYLTNESYGWSLRSKAQSEESLKASVHTALRRMGFL